MPLDFFSSFLNTEGAEEETQRAQSHPLRPLCLKKTSQLSDYLSVRMLPTYQP